MEVNVKFWIFEFLKYAKLKDLRLVKRLGLILEALVENPEASIPEANAGWGATKAA